MATASWHFSSLYERKQLVWKEEVPRLGIQCLFCVLVLQSSSLPTTSCALSQISVNVGQWLLSLQTLIFCMVNVGEIWLSMLEPSSLQDQNLA